MRGDWAPEKDLAISAQALTLTYGDIRILRGIDIALPAGQTLALLGPSGCGKTTLLRLVAGLLAPTSGQVSIHGQVVAGPGVFLPPEKRRLGMVFQDYALWPHLTVAGNVVFPLEMAGVGRAEREARVIAALDRVGLGAMAARSPSALSGGQQQRVAIARAIVGEPRIVLFDEPLSNLDRELREAMVEELGALIRGLGLTVIYVTHDQTEALTLADQSHGRLSRCPLKGTIGDALFAVLCACGHNIRKNLAHLRAWIAWIIAGLWASQTPSDRKHQIFMAT